LSSGCATELAQLMSDLSREFRQGDAAAGRVRGWLGKGMDLSQVGSGWGLDPLAHSGADLGLQVMNKTGTDAGIRAEVGVLTGPAANVAYAVLANWNEVDQPERRSAVLQRQSMIGWQIAAVAHGRRASWPAAED
jgi:beta-lactamase class A